MNVVCLVGNLTRDPELRQTNTGLATCSFSIAINRMKSKNGVQETDYIPIVTWRNTAENCAKYLHKGSKVGVTGELRTRSYDAKDGSKRFVVEVVAGTVDFLTQRNQKSSDEYTPAPEVPTTPEGFIPVNDEELPF